MPQKCDFLWQQPNIWFLTVNNTETSKHHIKDMVTRVMVVGAVYSL